MSKLNPRELGNLAYKALESMTAARKVRDVGRASSQGGLSQYKTECFFKAFQLFFESGQNIKDLVGRVGSSDIRYVNTGAQRLSVPELRLIAAECYEQAALAADHLGDFETAVRCMELATSQVDNKKFNDSSFSISVLASVDNNFGWFLFRKGDPGELPEARRRIESAIQLYSKSSRPDKRRLAELNLEKIEKKERGEDVELDSIKGFRSMAGGGQAVSSDYGSNLLDAVKFGENYCAAQWSPDRTWVIINGKKFNILIQP